MSSDQSERPIDREELREELEALQGRYERQTPDEEDVVRPNNLVTRGKIHALEFVLGERDRI